MFNFAIYAADTASNSAQAAASSGSPWASMIFFLILIAALMLLMIIPQKKREKKAQAMLDSLKPGMRIRTIGGIYGTIVTVKKDYITIVSGPDDVKLEFLKGAIATIEDAPQSEEAVEEAAEETALEFSEDNEAADNAETK